MNENIITWNWVNWVTIVLMAAVGFLILAGAAQGFHALMGTNTGTNSAQAVGAGGLQ
jgi:hypothetical protein